MRIKEIISESPSDLIARYHDMSRGDFVPNPEAETFAEVNREYYQRFFKDFFDTDEVFVFDKNDGTEQYDPMTTIPKDGDRYSAGYRGKQLALKHSGQKYDKDKTAP